MPRVDKQTSRFQALAGLLYESSLLPDLEQALVQDLVKLLYILAANPLQMYEAESEHLPDFFEAVPENFICVALMLPKKVELLNAESLQSEVVLVEG